MHPHIPLATDAHEQHQVRDAYGTAFLLVLVSTLALIATDASIESWLTAVAALLQVCALIVTLRVSGVTRRKTLIMSGVAVGVLVAGVIAVGTGGSDRTSIGIALWLTLTLATLVAIVRRLMTYRRVNIPFVLGLLTIHLLIGLSFGLGYSLVESRGVVAFAQGSQGLSGCLYFSYVTLSTLGYGDISPASYVVRALSVAEATIGQIYLVSVVAFAVGRLIVRPSEESV
jgi:hypothetical protein